MIRLLFPLLFLAFFTCTYSQNNPFPDYQIEEHILAKDQKAFNNLPKLPVPSFYTSEDLPASLDNSTNQFFPGILNQIGWSCNQASSIGYTLTYEYNLLNRRPSEISKNQFDHVFIWSLLNKGNWSQGVSYFDSWELVKKVGAANVDLYNNVDEVHSMWMDGYDNYFKAMSYRINDVYSLYVGNENGLNQLKHHLFNHFGNSEYGGIANFQIGSHDMGIEFLPEESEYRGEYVIKHFGPEVGHALTFIGYNDSVKLDINHDGLFTNDVDINEDGVVDMQDWEVGAMLTANTWGANWCNQGKVWVMYRCLALPLAEGGIWNNSVMIAKAKEEFSPSLTMKLGLYHPNRSKLQITAGVSTDPEASEPEHIIYFPAFNYQGGEFPMQGDGLDPEIEIGLDVTPLLNYVNSGQEARYFINVTESDPNNYFGGLITNFSLIDVKNGQNEMEHPETELVLNNNSVTRMYLNHTFKTNKPMIINESLPLAEPGFYYEENIVAKSGTPPYKWKPIKKVYNHSKLLDNYPEIEGELIMPVIGATSQTEMDLSFEFPFYGKSYDKLLIHKNGIIYLADSLAVYPYVIDRDIHIRKNSCIAAFLSDIDLKGDRFRVYFLNEENKAWVKWVYTGPYMLEFTLCLNADGNINFYYNMTDDLANTGLVNWSTGISEGNENNYSLLYNHRNTKPVINEHFRLEYEDVPKGMELNDQGVLSGTPVEAGKTWNLHFVVEDNNYMSTEKVLQFSTRGMKVNEMNNTREMLYCYPNPFSDQINIRIENPASQNISIKVYDMQGRMITKIKEGQILSGKHILSWNGKDDNGKSMPAGIYHLSLESPKGTQSFKIIKQ